MDTALNTRRMYYANIRAKIKHRDFNCWGATLFVLGINKRLEWVLPRPIEEWLDQNTKKIYRPRKKGDILVIHDRFGDLQHTAVYLGRGKYFHKRGSNIAEITTLKGVMQVYPFNKSFRRRI